MRCSWRLALTPICAAAVVLGAPAHAAESPAKEPSTPRPATRCAPPLDREQILRMLAPHWGKGPTAADIVAPRVTVLDETDCGDHVRRHLAYYVEQEEEAYAYLLVPKRRGDARLPLVMCPHPTNRWGKDMVVGKYDRAPAPDREEKARRAYRRYGLDLVKRGFVCFAPDAPGYGERSPLPNDPSWSNSTKRYQKELQRRWPGWSYHAKCVWDLQRALDFLVRLPEVDPARVATIGHSLGGWHSLFLAAADVRIQATVINAGGSIYFRRELWESRDALLRYLGDPAAQSMYLNTNPWLMAIAPRPLLYLKALNDIQRPDEPNVLDGYRWIADYYRQAPGNAGKPVPFAIYIHHGGHSFDEAARELAYHWLAQQLGPAPTSEPRNETP